MTIPFDNEVVPKEGIVISGHDGENSRHLVLLPGPGGYVVRVTDTALDPKIDYKDRYTVFIPAQSIDDVLAFFFEEKPEGRHG